MRSDPGAARPSGNRCSNGLISSRGPVGALTISLRQGQTHFETHGHTQAERRRSHPDE